MHLSPMLLTDSYKLTHWKQYPPGTTNVYSYFESRGGKAKETLFFGLQYLLKHYLTGPVVNAAMIPRMEALANAHFGQSGLFNRAGWEHVAKAHKGHLPLRIKAVREGSVVPVRNVLMTVENTCPECYWLTNYIETLLVQTWYPITVASRSRAIKQIILKYLDRTGDPALIDFKLHDFGYRGVSSVESAGWGGAAHLVNFKGTDTLAALALIDAYYSDFCAGFSIPASEHSTITAWGKEHEVDAFRNMLTQYPTGLVACVSDSFDIAAACSELWGTQLHTEVMGRNGTLVVRPDSGYPPKMCVEVLNLLGLRFGATTNAKGFKVLDPHVRVIYGDSMDEDMIELVLHSLQAAGWSADNLAFGSGGGLLQKMDRDTHQFAFKCSAMAKGTGVWFDVYKDPVTDMAKRSKRGRLALVIDGDGLYKTIPEDGLKSELDNELVLVFEDGKLGKDYQFREVRALAALPQPLTV